MGDRIVTDGAEIFRNLIFFYDKTVYQIWAKSDKIFSFLFWTLEPGLIGGEKGCHAAQNLCSRFFLNSEDPKLQWYHSFGGVLTNLKFDFFLTLKVEFFWDFYILYIFSSCIVSAIKFSPVANRVLKNILLLNPGQ